MKWSRTPPPKERHEGIGGVENVVGRTYDPRRVYDSLPARVAQRTGSPSSGRCSGSSGCSPTAWESEFEQAQVLFRHSAHDRVLRKFVIPKRTTRPCRPPRDHWSERTVLVHDAPASHAEPSLGLAEYGGNCRLGLSDNPHRIRYPRRIFGRSAHGQGRSECESRG